MRNPRATRAPSVSFIGFTGTPIEKSTPIRARSSAITSAMTS
jgi:hypothetical protein